MSFLAFNLRLLPLAIFQSPPNNFINYAYGNSFFFLNAVQNCFVNQYLRVLNFFSLFLDFCQEYICVLDLFSFQLTSCSNSETFLLLLLFGFNLRHIQIHSCVILSIFELQGTSALKLFASILSWLIYDTIFFHIFCKRFLISPRQI